MLTEILSLIRRPEFEITLPVLSPQQITSIVLVAFFCLCLILEVVAPKRKISRNSLKQSIIANFNLFIFNSIVVGILSVSSLLLIAKNNVSAGLLSGLSDPVLETMLSLLAMDLMLFVWHLICHRFDCLWMFHKVHHSDSSINVSTGFRLHIIEVLLTFILKGSVIIALGMNELTVLISEACTTLFIMGHHTNIAFKAEKWLNYLFITPYLHRSHHSVERKEHDSNYGAILSIWDRLFCTLQTVEPAYVGVKGNSPTDFLGLLLFGFTGQTPTAPAMKLPARLEEMIDVAAYYKAEKRNFDPRYDIINWLEAKQEVQAMIERKYRQEQQQALVSNREKVMCWLQQFLHPMNMNGNH